MKILSGGQTGVDRAALDVAMELGLPCGGWCPKGRRAEDGRIPDKYPLNEMPTREYGPRTRRNVEVCDATLVIYRGTITAGSLLTVKIVHELHRQCFAVDLKTHPSPDGAAEGIRAVRAKLKHRAMVLNVAGSRESSAPGIYEEASAFLRVLFSALAS